MRKIIETTSTLVLWVIWIVGSSIAISDFFVNAQISRKILLHLSLIAWSPVMAVGIFAAMLLAVRFSKKETTKKAIPNEHKVQWTTEELSSAQSGKMVDLFFQGTGIECQVVIREEAALVLHNENQTMHVTVASSESTITLLPHAL
ncbi:MAG: hypothetical protein ACM3MG_02640 [Bacillota bacterium]